MWTAKGDQENDKHLALLPISQERDRKCRNMRPENEKE